MNLLFRVLSIGKGSIEQTKDRNIIIQPREQRLILTAKSEYSNLQKINYL